MQLRQLSFANTTQVFTDIAISPYHWSIEELAKVNVVEGYADGTFRPTQEINRAEFLKIVLASKRVSFDAAQKNCFPDVREQWFAPYVCLASSQKLIEGYPDGFFRPEKSVNYVEALKMLYQTYEQPGKETATAQWFSPYFEDATEKGIVLKELGRSYDHLLTRGEMAELIVRFLKIYMPDKNVVQIPGTDLQYILPPDHTVQFDSYEGLPGPFLAYDVKAKNISFPSFHRIWFFSENSIKEFQQKCSNVLGEGGLCFEGAYPALEDYQGLKEAFANKKPYKNYEVKIIGGGYPLVFNEKCSGDTCVLRHYVTFFGDMMVDVSILRSVMDDGSLPSEDESDLLFLKLQQTSSHLSPFNTFSLDYPEEWRATYDFTFDMVDFGPKNSQTALWLERKIAQSPQEAQQFIDQKLEHLKQTNFKVIQKMPLKFQIEGALSDGTMIVSEIIHTVFNSNYPEKFGTTDLEIIVWVIKDKIAYFLITHIEPKNDAEAATMEAIMKSFKVFCVRNVICRF